MTEPTIQHAEMFEALKRVALPARDAVAERVATGAWIPDTIDYPDIGQYDSGLPRITHTSQSKARDYSALFTVTGDRHGPQFAWTSYPLDAFNDAALGVDAIVAHLRAPDHLIPDQTELLDQMLRLRLSTAPFELLNRAIQLYGLDFTSDDLRAIWREREIRWTASTSTSTCGYRWHCCRCTWTSSRSRRVWQCAESPKR